MTSTINDHRCGICAGLLTCSSRGRLAERINRERRNAMKVRGAQ